MTTPPSRPRPARRRTGRGVLAVIAGLMVASGLVRLGEGAGQVLAAGTAEAEVALPETAGETCQPDAPTADLLEAFRQREERLAQRELQMADRMQALRLAETEITEKLASLEEAEASLAATLNLAGDAAENDISRLTAVYENMRAEDVAALFEEMSPEFSSGFLARMNPEAAAAVMTYLTPNTAYSISVVIAGRYANVPRE